MQLSKRAILNGSLGVVVVAAIVGVYFVINPPTASTASGATAAASEVAASFPVASLSDAKSTLATATTASAQNPAQSDNNAKSAPKSLPA